MADRARGRANQTSSAPSQPVDSKMAQVHNVQVGDQVVLNGTIFTITSGQYEWSMSVPENSTAALMNPTMPSPSFVPDMEGDYHITLPTDEGAAEILVHVS